MLQIVHDKIQGWVAGVIAFIIALTFVLWGVQYYLRTGATRMVAKVNGTEITQGQLQVAYEQAKRARMLRSGPDYSFDQKAQNQLKKDVLQQLIKQQVIFQAQNKMGLGIGKKQLWEAVYHMPIFQVDGSFSAARFRQLVRSLYYSEHVFFEEMENSFLQMQLERGVVASAFVLPHEADLIKKIFKQQRDFGYFVVAAEYFARKANITESAIKKYYDENQSEFLLPEKVSIKYIELSSDSLRSTVKVSAEQLKQFYQNHIASFSTPKKWRVMKILLPLPVTADNKILEKDRKKIENIATAIKDGGNVSKLDSRAQVTTIWMAHGDVSPDYLAHLEKLNVGQVSLPFRTKDGYTLLKVQAVQPEKIMPYASVVAKVKKAYEQQQLTQAFSDAVNRLSDLVYTNPDLLEPAAKEFNLKIQETDLFVNDSSNGHGAHSKNGILANNKIIKTAFSEAVLKQHYNSNPIEIGSGKVVVLRIKDHIPEKVQPLDEVRAIIAEKLRNEIGKQGAANLAKELLAALQSGKDENQIAGQHGMVWRTVHGAKYNDGGAHAKLVSAAFDLSKPKKQAISAAIVADTNGDHVVLRLDRVYDDSTSLSFGQDSEMRKAGEILRSLPEEMGRFDYQLFLNNLMQRAKIKIVDQEKIEIR